jgi:ATP phosphoribosyltransferase
MCVAGFKGFRDSHSKTLRVATKFPILRARTLQARAGNRRNQAQRFHELAPILGLSDVIVDLVETGKTLAENGLAVLETISPISARLVANKASLSFRGKEIEALRAGLEGVVVAK